MLKNYFSVNLLAIALVVQCLGLSAMGQYELPKTFAEVVKNTQVTLSPEKIEEIEKILQDIETEYNSLENLDTTKISNFISRLNKLKSGATPGIKAKINSIVKTLKSRQIKLKQNSEPEIKVEYNSDLESTILLYSQTVEQARSAGQAQAILSGAKNTYLEILPKLQYKIASKKDKIKKYREIIDEYDQPDSIIGNFFAKKEAEDKIADLDIEIGNLEKQIANAEESLGINSQAGSSCIIL